MNRITSIQIIAALGLLAAACVPPAQSSGGGGGGNPSVASGGGGGGTCEGACAHVVECGLVPDDGSCPGQCQELGYDAQTLGQFEAGSCEQIEQWLSAGSQTPAQPGDAGGGGGGAVECTAQGLYEVCDGEFCRDKVSESVGSGDTQDAAGMAARQSCSSHMSRMTIIENTNNRASIKRSCEVVSCR